MRNDHEHIEEKLIPYLEGVLNPKERREIDEAINSDGNLAREMSELREIILELRTGFASGMKPPQEELSVEEVVELGYHVGPGENMPGTSQQKARLFCSDAALEEYSMLRALQEELARTELDRENVPEMPAALLQEFRGLKPAAGVAGRKVLPFDRGKLSPIPLWKRASAMLDRIDPKPLMASAAALVMLSLGVHLYNRPAAAPGGGEGAQIGYNFNDEKKAGPAPTPAASASSTAPDPNGVAVFTSDDRGLLKEQAEKLLSNKIRYTVTKDRILVAEKDVDEARGILWKDVEGKAVAMGKAAEPAAVKRMTTVSGGAASADGAASPNIAGVVVGAAVPDTAGASEVIDADRELSQPSDTPPPISYYPPSVAAAPAKPEPPRPPRAAARRNAGIAASPRTGGGTRSALQAGSDQRVPLNSGLQHYQTTSPPPKPTVVESTVSSDAPGYSAPDPTVVDVRSKANENAVPMSAERRQKLKELALGGEESGRGAPADENLTVADKEEAVRDAVAPPPPAPAPVTPSQVQTTTTMNRARIAAGPPPASTANAPVANVVTAPGTLRSENEDDLKQEQAESRLARMESNRQAVAQRNGVELSFESKDGKVSVYVRPKKALSKAELDALRKTLRKELGLADSDTLIFR